MNPAIAARTAAACDVGDDAPPATTIAAMAAKRFTRSRDLRRSATEQRPQKHLSVMQADEPSTVLRILNLAARPCDSSVRLLSAASRRQWSVGTAQHVLQKHLPVSRLHFLHCRVRQALTSHVVD